MNPWEKELTEALREQIRKRLSEKKEEGMGAVVKAMEKQLESLEDYNEVKEDMIQMTEEAAKERFLEALETENARMQDKYWHYSGDY